MASSPGPLASSPSPDALLRHPPPAQPPERGVTYAIEVGDYFVNQEGRIARWIFRSAPPDATQGLAPFEVPYFNRTIGQWFNLLVAVGFILDRVEEPRPSDEVVRAYPAVQDAQVVAYYLHIRVRKQGAFRQPC